MSLSTVLKLYLSSSNHTQTVSVIMPFNCTTRDIRVRFEFDDLIQIETIGWFTLTVDMSSCSENHHRMAVMS